MEYIIGLIIGSAVHCLFEGGLSCHSLVVKALGEQLLKWVLWMVLPACAKVNASRAAGPSAKLTDEVKFHGHC